ncbi:hypothetical protein [Paraburkholderia sp. BL6665CI2N2]|nr:hypothetical protein [Paraburkholderia sp. BL6665CI2N2]
MLSEFGIGVSFVQAMKRRQWWLHVLTVMAVIGPSTPLLRHV